MKTAGKIRLARLVREHGPVGLVVALFVVTGFRGIDCGKHWDEQLWQLGPVHDMIVHGGFVPGPAPYPAFAKWLILLPAALRGLASFVGGATAVEARGAIAHTLEAPSYLFLCRYIFVSVSALAIVWTWLGALAFGLTRTQALVAAAALGVSWEFAYHARWVVTDCLVLQFAALTLFLVARYLERSRLAWLYGAAAAAGLGFGSKYPALPLLLPVLLAAWLGLRQESLRRRALVASVVVLVFTGTYSLTTPITFLRPQRWLNQILVISHSYSAEHHLYGVSGHGAHFARAVLYLAVSFFSPYWPLSLALFALALVGAVAWLKERRDVALLVLSFPVALLVLMAGRYNVMIARNYLPIAPFLCVFLGRGVAFVGAHVPRGWPERAFLGLVAAVFVVNGVWLVRAAESIREPDARGYVRDALAYAASHPALSFKLSSRVASAAREQSLPLSANAGGGPSWDEVLYFANADEPKYKSLITNDPWLAVATFGPQEVNFNWYPTWIGHDRLVLLTRAKAEASGLELR